jgi:hypothetical protein
MTFFTQNIQEAYRRLCNKAEATLAAAVNRNCGAADELLPQHAGEVDLNALSEKELQHLSCSIAGYVYLNEISCRYKLTDLRGVRESCPPAYLPKVNKAINVLRARITLLQRKKQSSINSRAQWVSTNIQMLLLFVCRCCQTLEP